MYSLLQIIQLTLSLGMLKRVCIQLRTRICEKCAAPGPFSGRHGSRGGGRQVDPSALTRSRGGRPRAPRDVSAGGRPRSDAAGARG